MSERRQFEESEAGRWLARIKAEWRAQWEAELLSDEAMDRAWARVCEFQGNESGGGRGSFDREMRAVIRCALGGEDV